MKLAILSNLSVLLLVVTIIMKIKCISFLQCFNLPVLLLKNFPLRITIQQLCHLYGNLYCIIMHYCYMELSNLLLTYKGEDSIR